MKTISIFKYLFSIIGLAMLAAAFFIYQNTVSFIAQASTTDGIVINLVPSTSNDSTTYKPVVQFSTASGESVEFTTSTSSNPPAYNKGEQVTVLYLATNPQHAKIDGYFSLWAGVTILGALGGVFFLIGGGMILSGRLKNRSTDWLKHNGVPIQTRYQRTELNESLTVNGKNPFHIISQWLNPATSELHIFRSNNLWFDPSDHIKRDTITVFIKTDNPKKYYMDLSFLPRLAQ